MLRFVSLCALGLLATRVAALEEIRIASPATLASRFPNGIYNRPALFGQPPYGVSITGRVYWATPGDRDGCSAINTSVVDNWPTASDVFIVMVDRGDCTFVTKVRHAQEVSAKAVIIVDNQEEENLPFMADDGTGNTITIPSLLIRKKDGAIIKEAFADSPVIATMRWGVPNPDGVVEWALWTSSYDENSVELKSSFQLVMDSLNDSSVFAPHYFFLDGTVYGCQQNGGTACGNQCTNMGKYCDIDPDHNLNYGISGADVVKENLRQLCIWNNVNKTGSPDKWWKYVNCFQNQCTNNSDFTLSCSKKCQTQFGISSELIDQCVTSSGGSEASGGINNLIANEIKARADSGVFFLPTVIVNNTPYRGNLNCPVPISSSQCGVLEAICAGYASGTVPATCRDNGGCAIGEVRDVCGKCLTLDDPTRQTDAANCATNADSAEAASKQGVSAASVVGIVFIMVTIVSLGFFYLHRRSQASMRRELADIMQQYVPLSNEDKGDDKAVPSAIDETGPPRRKSSLIGN